MPNFAASLHKTTIALAVREARRGAKGVGSSRARQEATPYFRMRECRSHCESRRSSSTNDTRERRACGSPACSAPGDPSYLDGARGPTTLHVPGLCHTRERPPVHVQAPAAALRPETEKKGEPGTGDAHEHGGKGGRHGTHPVPCSGSRRSGWSSTLTPVMGEQHVTMTPHGTNPDVPWPRIFVKRRGTPLTPLCASGGVSPVPGCAANVAGGVAPVSREDAPVGLPGPYTAGVYP
jgi:hypothetical protein